jgi:hypothetical protein
MKNSVQPLRQCKKRYKGYLRERETSKHKKGRETILLALGDDTLMKIKTWHLAGSLILSHDRVGILYGMIQSLAFGEYYCTHHSLLS